MVKAAKRLLKNSLSKLSSIKDIGRSLLKSQNFLMRKTEIWRGKIKNVDVELRNSTKHEETWHENKKTSFAFIFMVY